MDQSKENNLDNLIILKKRLDEIFIEGDELSNWKPGLSPEQRKIVEIYGWEDLNKYNLYSEISKEILKGLKQKHP
ncbi:MAG: hypothetical protein WC812_02205 [Candidatus Pacearchaeota archaeon]|jgi:hypothetical protein